MTSRLLGISLLFLGTIIAQTPTASLSGRVLSEDGRTLRAVVTLSFAEARGFPGPSRRVSTDANGNFTFSRLAAAKYQLCAQIAASEAAPANSPYIDTCVWGSEQSPIAVADGQAVTGVVFTAPRGAWMQIRVLDPDHVLPQAVPSKGPAPLEPELQLVLRGPDKLYRHARFVSMDPAGRSYRVAVPLKTALNLQITSTVANVSDQNGNQIHPTDQAGFQPNAPADLGMVTYTLHRKQ
jgi:hypothetical protein